MEMSPKKKKKPEVGILSETWSSAGQLCSPSFLLLILLCRYGSMGAG